MIHLVYGLDKQVAAWVAAQIGLHNYDPCKAIGVARDDDIIAGCLYNNYHETKTGKPISIEITMVALDKRWCNRAIIKQLLFYPFGQLKVERVQLSAPKRNKFVRRFNERLGFKFEGIARKAYFTGEDAAVYSMLRQEWIKGPYGKIESFGTGSTRSECNGERANSQQSGYCAL